MRIVAALSLVGLFFSASAVHLFGDTTIVTYIKEYWQTPDTANFVDEDHSDVFIRDAPGWLCA